MAGSTASAALKGRALRRAGAIAGLVAGRGDASWRPIGVVSVAASALIIVFLFVPWGNASFLLAIITLFAWMAAIAIRLATHQQSQQDQQAT